MWQKVLFVIVSFVTAGYWIEIESVIPNASLQVGVKAATLWIEGKFFSDKKE